MNDLAPRDVFGISSADLHAIGKLGASALVLGRAKDARMLFAALVALEPDRPEHLFHLAYACRAGGDVAAALKWLGRFLSSPISDDDRARALLLRVELCARTDRRHAERDLASVRALAARSAAARAVLEGA